jgi:hypothetical protein
MIFCEEADRGAPHVMYKDRQHLLELNLEGELVSGKEVDPPVYLINYDVFRYQPVKAWQTSVKEWLPFPFSPLNLGSDFVKYLTTYFQAQSRLASQH